MGTPLDAGSFEEIQQEVQARFAGSWPAFLEAVQSPIDILLFLLTTVMEGDKHQFQAWAQIQGVKEKMVLVTMERFDNPEPDAPPRGGILGSDIGLSG